MCGIYGFFNFSSNQLIQEEIMCRMSMVLRHRGPDETSYLYASKYGIGNERLSIIDIEGGKQPFFSHDKKVAVVQNGEIFNYLELREELISQGVSFSSKSDTEVILRGYQKHGINYISKLNGMFAIAILDRNIDTLFLIRDRIGEKPLYYTEENGLILFASEIKSILETGYHTPQPDFDSLSDYLSFNYVPSPRTAFKNIKHLSPGHYLEVSQKGITNHKWWDLADITPVEGRSESDWNEEFLFLLESSTKLRMRSDVAYGAFLSGGVDSTSIVAQMAKLSQNQISTFSIGFEDPAYDESFFALEAARKFKTKHITQFVSQDLLDLWPLTTYHCDQPHGDVSFMPMRKLSELARAHIKVALTGDGGDELFGGYTKYLDILNSLNPNPSLDHLTDTIHHKIRLFSLPEKKKLINSSQEFNQTSSDPKGIIRSCLQKVEHQDIINRILYLEMIHLLNGNNLIKTDRMAMSVGLETRSPYLDYRMMEFAFRMPGVMKLRANITKHFLKQAVAPVIGEKLSYRKKQMFTVPIGDWFRTSKYEYCVDNMPNFLFSKDILMDLCTRHKNGTENYTRELRALIAIKHWATKFFPIFAQ